MSMEEATIPLETDSESLGGSGGDLHRHRRIIICCDGTWNDRETNQPFTNVTRIQSCFSVRDERHLDTYEQLSYYIDGIGSGTTWGGAIHDGSTGRGIERKIREAYKHLCHTYTDEADEIVLIGFSRGAFTVRCLASLIHDVGLLDGGWVSKELPAIFELWKKQRNSDRPDDAVEDKSTPLEKHCQALIAKYDKPQQPLAEGQPRGTILRRKVLIKACAVWDSVKSLGFPWPRGVPHKKSKQFSFVNYRVTPNIENAFQALSLDERRWHFQPMVWSKSHKDQALKQCWFLGSHSDIGGGYRNAGFANVSLCWMISQLRHLVLFNERAIWHSTEEGNILDINVAKENMERFWPSRSRVSARRNRILPRQRSRSTPPVEDARSSSQRSRLPILRFKPWFRNSRQKKTPSNLPTSPTNVPPITIYQSGAESASNIGEGEIEDMYGPILPVPLDLDTLTPDEASLNPEAEGESVEADPDGSSSATSEEDEERESPTLTSTAIAIASIHRHPFPPMWVVGGSKTRKVGIYRKAADDSRTIRGTPSSDNPDENLGSNESVHFSVRILTEIHPLKGRKRCRALKKLKITEIREGSFVWHYTNPVLNIRDIPEDIAEGYEYGMLHRWLDRDFAARDGFGGQEVSEAIAGNELSSA